MKKTLLALAAVLLLAACSDDEYTVYETVAPRLYVLDKEFVDLTATYAETPVFTVHVCRSGNSTATVDVALGVHTAALVAYNYKTDGMLQLLPGNCYRIPETRALSTGGAYQLAFDVELDQQAIRTLPAGDYALPLGISSEKAAIDPSLGRVILGFSVR